MNKQMFPQELHDVVAFRITANYTIWLKFDDGSEQQINFEPILHGPLFAPLQDLTVFNQVVLDEEIGTLVWPTGADIDPNVLYDWSNHVEAIIGRRQQMKAHQPIF